MRTIRDEIWAHEYLVGVQKGWPGYIIGPTMGGSETVDVGVSTHSPWTGSQLEKVADHFMCEMARFRTVDGKRITIILDIEDDSDEDS